MKVILLKDIERLGDKYDVLKSLKDAEEVKRMKMLEEFRKNAELIEGKVFTIGAKAGTTEKIFGSVTNVQLANKIKEDLGIDLDRKIIEIEEEVKTLGEHKAKVNLHREVVATMTFEVVKE